MTVLQRSQVIHDMVSVPCTIADDRCTLPVKVFSTGSLGWYYSGKHTIKVGDGEQRCQVQVTVTIVGSKDWPGKPQDGPGGPVDDEVTPLYPEVPPKALPEAPEALPEAPTKKRRRKAKG